jgi:hypothetical protein
MRRTTFLFLALLVARAAAAELPAVHVIPAPAMSPAAREATHRYRFHHGVGPGMPIPDGYVDGGRHMGLHADGRATSYREILVIDRSKDDRLRTAIEKMRSDAIRKLPPQKRSVAVAREVLRLCSAQGGPTHTRGVGDLQTRYANRGVLAGEVGVLCGAGVCRHRSLLYKVLGDAADLRVALARGRYKHSDGRTGGHAWNELHLDNGTVFLVDLMASISAYRGIRHPKVVSRYLTVGRRPMYAKGLVPRRPPYIHSVEQPPCIDRARITFAKPYVDTTVHYTLDGTQPTETSPAFTEPIPVRETTTVKAFARFNNGDKSRTVATTIRVLSYRSPVDRDGLERGLRYRYYEGVFKSMPAFDTLKPRSNGRAAGFGIGMAKAKDHFALLFTGYVRVPKRGVYTFHVRSDDGSKLWTGDKCIVDNDGRHADQERSGAVALEAGLHPVRLGYFEYNGGESLSVTWSGPGIKRQPMPAEALLSGAD